MDRPYITFYRSFYEAFAELPDQNRLELYDAITAYGFTEKEPDLTGISLSIWKLIKPNLDVSIKRYKAGSKPKTKQTRSKPEAKAKQTANDKDKDKDKEKEKGVVRGLKEFKERREELIEEVSKLYPNTDVRQAHQDIVDYCESKGKKYKNYLAALRQWVRQDNYGNYRKTTTGFYREL